MDSRLDLIFATRFRHAETTDTRQGIRREEKAGDRKKKENRKDNQGNPETEDDTTISVQALQTFLTNLVVSEKEGEKQETGTIKDFTDTPPTRTSSALEAYRTAQSTQDSSAAPPPSTANKPTLTPEEKRIIHSLLRDLAVLSEKKIDYLRLAPAASFLESLREAVNKA